MGANFKVNRTTFKEETVHTVQLCVCTNFEVAVAVFLPVIFKHGKRGRDKLNLLVLFLLM
jgi:hypothetical protein